MLESATLLTLILPYEFILLRANFLVLYFRLRLVHYPCLPGGFC